MAGNGPRISSALYILYDYTIRDGESESGGCRHTFVHPKDLYIRTSIQTNEQNVAVK